MTMAYLWAWLLTTASGAFLSLALSAAHRPGRIATALGYGVALGMLGAAAFTALSAQAGTTHAWLHAAPWLGLAGALAGCVALFRQYRAPVAAADVGEKVEYWKSVAIGAMLASLLWRGSIIGSEVLLRPTYPWDAWDAWAVKSKTWFLLGHYVPFVAVADWLRHGTAELYSGPAWAYPSTLGWMQVWFASAAGGWIEQLVNLPWLVLWAGLLLGHYGQWRALGLNPRRAAIFVYVLGSLPLLASHVALAGYADLWIATMFGFSVLAWLRWQERGERDQLIMALICAAVLPLLKLEGMVWFLSLLAAIAFGALSPRWRWRAAAIAAAVLLGVILIGQAQMLFAAIGWVRSGSRVVDIPVIGKLSLTWHGDAAIGVMRSLFTQSNWHLLWWCVAPLLIWRWRVLKASQALCLCALLLLACFGLLVILFVFTDAAEWAESYTAVNRLVMHITPAVISLLALLMREPALPPEPARTAAARDPQPHPA
jgi:hypothetical protein